MIGIVDYGYYLPLYRIKTETIAQVWGKRAIDIKRSLLVNEKTVAGLDEDSLTMAYQSASMALSNLSNKEKKKIKVVFFGSETPPYAVNPASTILAEFLDINYQYLASDLQFACKAATGAIISALGLINNYNDYALVSASDKANAKTHDPLEYTAASGSVSLLLGKASVAVEIIDYQSFSSDTPDFWRREGIRYPSHGGRFTGKPSYFYHVYQASQLVLKKTRLKPKDFQYAIFHMPNGRFPQEIARGLGFERKQIESGLTVFNLGNFYTASALMGLVAVLEKAKEDDLILLSSYGSGAGSDAFVLRVTKELKKIKKPFLSSLDKKRYIDYLTYLKFIDLI